MPQLRALRAMRQRSQWSQLEASKAKESTMVRDERTGYPQTADDPRSSQATPSEPPHCRNDTWFTPSSDTLRDLRALADIDDGVPYSQAEIRKRAEETAIEYVASVNADCVSPEALSRFSSYASHLEGDEDLGILECPNAMRPWTVEDRIAISAAWTIVRFGRLPTRDEALEYLLSGRRTKTHFQKRLNDTKAAYGGCSRPSNQPGRSTVQQARTGLEQ